MPADGLVVSCAKISADAMMIIFQCRRYTYQHFNSPLPGAAYLTEDEWRIYISKLAIIGGDNVLAPGRRRAIIWTNGGILIIRTEWTNASETSGEIHAFSFKKKHLKTSSAKWRPFCLGLNVMYATVDWVSIGSGNGLVPIRRYHEVIRYRNHCWVFKLNSPLDIMAAISQKMFSDEFLRTKSLLCRLKFHWSLLLRVQLTITQHWVRWWLGAE